MTAAHKLTTASPGETIELSRKARLGEKVTWQVSDWEKPAANDCCIREKTEAKVRWPSGQGLYTYVVNDPVNFIDPRGSFLNIATGIAGAIVGAVVGGAVAIIGRGDFGAGVLAGALSGGSAGLSFGGSLLFGGAFGALLEASNQRLNGDCLSFGKIAKAAVFGVTGSAIGRITKAFGVTGSGADVIGVAGGGFGAIVQAGIDAQNR